MKARTQGMLTVARERMLGAVAKLPSEAAPPRTRFRLVKGLLLRAMRIQSRQQRDFDRAVLEVLEAMRLGLEALDAKVESLYGRDALSDEDYAEFEEIFRGPLGDKLAIYPPLVRDALAQTGGGRVIDLGCGRGDLLRLLAQVGIEAQGVDTSPAMVSVCRKHGLEVNCWDALTALRALEDGSAAALLSLHMVEHWPVAEVAQLIRLAAAKLKPRGLLALETPFAIQGMVSRDFVLDPTHLRPVHPEFLLFVMKRAGFAERELRPLAPCGEDVRLKPLGEEAGPWGQQANRNFERLNDALFGFRDFVALGWR